MCWHKKVSIVLIKLKDGFELILTWHGIQLLTTSTERILVFYLVQCLVCKAFLAWKIWWKNIIDWKIDWLTSWYLTLAHIMSSESRMRSRVENSTGDFFRFDHFLINTLSFVQLTRSFILCLTHYCFQTNAHYWFWRVSMLLPCKYIVQLSI